MAATAREARARRRFLIRSRVVAATLSAFALAWGVIAFDGPMGAQADGDGRRPPPPRPRPPPPRDRGRRLPAVTTAQS